MKESTRRKEFLNKYKIPQRIETVCMAEKKERQKPFEIVINDECSKMEANKETEKEWMVYILRVTGHTAN